ncbi:MAG: hypothetical protein AAFY52_09160 [Pseudomonadota bacterium]
MYIGDTGKLGAACLVGFAAEISASLTVNRDRLPIYAHAAFLDVTLSGGVANVVIDASPEETNDFGDRIAQLVKNKDRLLPDEMTLGRNYANSAAPMPILRALSRCLHIAYESAEEARTILVENDGLKPDMPEIEKGLVVGVRFEFGEVLDRSELTPDYLEGFLEGQLIAPGLILRNFRVSHH